MNHIRVSVWENSGDNGNRWFNTTITRRYKDGDDWKDTSTYSGLADLALVAEATRLAREFIADVELQQAHDEL
ncbi:unnamed protein product [marine sediment metagenome]|uniref:Uncharacterized protein n=1 Tax=marine sediment metagenome TaxID=412755 RepID=X1BU70_9ZZZZ